MSSKTNTPLAWEKRKCRKKKAFATVKEAGIMSAHVFLNHKVYQRIYECPHCEKYHLATQEEKDA